MWSIWKIHKYLTFKPGLSQNGRFQEETWGRDLPSENRRIGTYAPHHLKHLVKYHLSIYGIRNFAKFFNKCINYLSHLFENDRIKSWTNLKDQHDLVDDIFFPVLQDKGNNFNHSDLNENNVYQNHHVTQEGRNLSLDKMSSK